MTDPQAIAAGLTDAQSMFTPERIEAAHAETERLQRELDITNADHIALWLEANDPYDGDAWLACQIADAYDRALACHSLADIPATLKALAENANVSRAVMASVKLGAWLSAALDDPTVCEAMKADIREWFGAGEPVSAIYAAVRSILQEQENEG